MAVPRSAGGRRCPLVLEGEDARELEPTWTPQKSPLRRKMYRPLDSHGAGTIMLSADYYRSQADVCVRLSVVQSDEAISRRLIMLAKAYMAEADDMARSTHAAAPGLSRSAERCSG
jgi:hypothetical protein